MTQKLSISQFTGLPLDSNSKLPFGTQHTHTRLMALFQGLPGWAGTRKVKPIWILLKQETVSGSGLSWAMCKSAPRCRQTTMPAPHHSVFYRPDALPAAKPTVSMHWRQEHWRLHKYNTICPVLLFIWVAIAAAQKEQQQYGGKSCSSEWMKIRHHYSKW